MVDNSCIIEGNVKFRDGKKWKSRWCVMRKLSPVADCLHLQLYGDGKDRFKNAQTKASLSLQHFLGVQSGFTLDKESNTIAIICQDITVVLAFDTRERLIQWQVKISNNLGEDRQFLVLISTAPTKAKLNNGPAHLRVQNYRFCITVGIPPRLVGIWEIAHLRRYGVIEGRFCFEGGSRCDRGEGLHVLITDQGDEIVKTFQLAVEGKLSSRKRSLNRGQSSQESPRNQFSRSETRVSDFISSASYSSNRYEEHCDTCKKDGSTHWCLAESRQEVESEDYNCRDSVSTSELIETNFSFSRHGGSGLERCASCIGKLGTISKSSTCVTTVDTSTISSPGVQSNNLGHLSLRAFDGLSLSSYSSSSHESDYSGSQRDSSFQQSECYCSQTKSEQTHSSPNPTIPPRPPKLKHEFTNAAKAKKAPMPLPNTNQSCTCLQKKNSIRKSDHSIGPYNNYDIPKPVLTHRMTLEQAESQVNQYYDTPRKIKECIALPSEYPNYDTPHVAQAVVLQQCGCPTKLAQTPRSSACPCQNVLSWAGFVLPYCRRGAGIESTGVTVQPIRLSGEGKMPVVNANGEVNFLSKNLSVCKIKKENHKEENNHKEVKINGEENNDKEINHTEINNKEANNHKKESNHREETTLHKECKHSKNDSFKNANYENIEPIIDTQPNSNNPNYVNIDFTQSLEHYENSKHLISKTGISENELEQLASELQVKGVDESTKIREKEDYLVLDVDKVPKKSISGYLPTQAAHNACSKQVLSRLFSGVKSWSNPTLSGSSPFDPSRKRSESEYRVPGSAMLSSPYLRRRLIDGNSKNETSIILRKRSYSAESARYLDDESCSFPLNSVDCSNETNNEIVSNSEESADNKMKEVSLVSHQDSFSSSWSGSCIKIRRSSSVPSKAGHNRDSSSSNDSGVSTGSLTHRNNEFGDFEQAPVPTSTPLKKKSTALMEHYKKSQPICFHNSLPRKSKSSDLLREITFQFQKMKMPSKSSSTEADIPSKETKGFTSPGDVTSAACPDSRSTSSGTSDMSDYIETLSLSSHSSTDTPDSLRHGFRVLATTLRPRSGKEYYKIDRSILVESGRNTNSPLTNYANIAPVIEKSESPSPGYMSSSPFDRQSLTREHFLFPKET